jgi:hypothetical protein
MKFFKSALLATAFIATSAMSAQADDLADLKTEIEALNARLASLEVAPSVPTGFRLMTTGKAPALVAPGFLRDSMATLPEVNTIAIAPTADMPSTAQVQWSGYARAAVDYDKTQTDHFFDANSDGIVDTFTVAPDDFSEAYSEETKDLHIKARGRMNLAASNDTSVGSVGVELEMTADWGGVSGGSVDMTKAWGYWNMTPGLALGGGYAGSIGGIGHGGDIMTALYNGGIGTTAARADTPQLRLTYSSGPMSASIALEDSDYGNSSAIDATTLTVLAADDSEIGVAGELNYAGDILSAEIAGYMHGGDWQIGSGLSAKIANMLTLSVAAGMGRNENTFFDVMAAPYNITTSTFTGFVAAYDRDYWNVSGVAVAHLADQFSLEVGASYEEGNGAFSPTFDIDDSTVAFAAGAYFTPVDQLTLGVEGAWSSTEQSITDGPTGPGADGYKDTETMGVDFVSVYRF